MNEKKTSAVKKPISHELIYKMMLIITLVVAAAFLVKNLVGWNVQGMLAIGISLAVFVIVHIFMKSQKVDTLRQEFVVSISLVCLVFIISLFSGASYSDDFPLFLAVIGMTGLYLEPFFTKVQIVLVDIFLVAMYLIHPEKAESISQYILCLVVFTLAACLFYQTIKRGRAFIEISQERAEEAEKLLLSIRQMGKELDADFQCSSQLIEDSTLGLQQGSESITGSAEEATNSCLQVHAKIQVTGQQIDELNSEVRKVERSLSENETNMIELSRQLKAVNQIIVSANQVFTAMAKQMQEVSTVAEELSDISFKTTLLSLNASIEAAHAGEAGAGFAVVASEMRELSENSDRFAEQVGDVVNNLLEQVRVTAEQFRGSAKALEMSEETMNELENSFGRLTEQFESLYSNIEEQNCNVTEVDGIFAGLKNKVAEIQEYSLDNQDAVDAIMDALDMYKININKVIEQTRSV